MTPPAFGARLADAMTARTLSVISVGVSRALFTPSALMIASWPLAAVATVVASVTSPATI